jgi:hypothetical protein
MVTRVYPVSVETVRIDANSSQLVVALEHVLPERGYRTLRSFDLPLVTAADASTNCHHCVEYGTGQCDCRYAVLLVFANQVEARAPGVIAVQGIGGSSVVSLSSFDENSDFVEQFTPLLIEVAAIASSSLSINGVLPK